MIFALVSILVFAATAALVAAILMRRREKEASDLKQRVGGRSGQGSSAATIMVERDTRMSSVPVLDSALKRFVSSY